MSDDSHIADAIAKLTRITALSAIRGAENKEAALILSRAGFSLQESGELLGISKQAVHAIVSKKTAQKKGKKG